MNASLSDATGAVLESETRFPGARPCTLADLLQDVHSDSPFIREHAIRMAYALGGLDGAPKVTRVLEGKL